MRLIGHLENQTLAEQVSQVLRTEGIQNLVEPGDEPGWALWVFAEDDIERARQLLTTFRSNPFPTAAQAARHPFPSPSRDRRAAATDAPARGSSRGSRSFEDRPAVAWVTLSLLAICLVVAARTGLTAQSDLVRLLQISEVPFRLGAGWDRFLPEVRAGQVWRLFTPALLHFGWPHILFNLWAFWDLGHLIERRAGPARLAILILGLGVISNLGQYIVEGPRFGGMSGAIYGLLGYLWMMGRFRPEAGMGLHPQTVIMMLVWFFICLSGALGVPVANWAHGVGLVAGVLWGLASAKHSG